MDAAKEKLRLDAIETNLRTTGTCAEDLVASARDVPDILNFISYIGDYPHITKTVLNGGANVNYTTPGDTRAPLHKALLRGRVETARAILDRPDANAAGDFMSLCIAVDRGHLDIVRLLLGHPKMIERPRCRWVWEQNRNQTILHLASTKGHADIMECLIREGDGISSIDWKDDDKNTPLHIAVRRGDQVTASVLMHNGAKIVDTDLFDDRAGPSPLILAEQSRDGAATPEQREKYANMVNLMRRYLPEKRNLEDSLDRIVRELHSEQANSLDRRIEKIRASGLSDERKKSAIAEAEKRSEDSEGVYSRRVKDAERTFLREIAEAEDRRRHRQAQRELLKNLTDDDDDDEEM